MQLQFMDRPSVQSVEAYLGNEKRPFALEGCTEPQSYSVKRCNFFIRNFAGTFQLLLKRMQPATQICSANDTLGV